ncbi:hypothetical protein [Pseudomonas sp. RGM2987]|uniref:hypothetical protein n=1 Tax=Pseudomonas sp. RGM2987 TaxID=2930090 RepID=UPI001FD6589D|nr:hypothetical protein [Pseudomonas sp. RGM2987]MCJ8205292.1 hypothetical protein [Pseudomonas sp. RGM2987]
MPSIKVIVAALLLSSQLTYSATAYSAMGTIILRDKDNAICSLPVPEPGQSKGYSFVNAPLQCEGWNKRARTLELAEVPSATRIILSDSVDCGRYSSNSWLVLKTRKKQTNTSIIAIEYLTTFQKDAIIEPGLQMIDLQIKTEFRDKVSCVHITTSAAPPSP